MVVGIINRAAQMTDPTHLPGSSNDAEVDVVGELIFHFLVNVFGH